MADLPEVLTPEEMQGLLASEGSSLPDTLTPQEMQNLLSSSGSTSQPEELAAGETFGRGIADMLGGRYIMPAAAAAVSKLGGDKRDFSDIYSDAQQFWDAPQDLSRTAGQMVGLAVPMAYAGKAASAVPAVSKTMGVVRTLGPIGKGSGVIPTAARIVGGAGTGAISGAAGSAVATPYMNMMLGKETTPEEVQEDTTTGALIGAGLGAAVPAIGASVDLVRKLANRYRAPNLSADYGKGFGKASIDKNGVAPDVKAVAAIKNGQYPGTKANLVETVESMPGQSSFIDSAINNSNRSDIAIASVEAMNAAHPGTAREFSRKVIEPRLRQAKSNADASVKVYTADVGTPKYMNDKANELDALYRVGLDKLKQVPPFEEAQVRDVLRQAVGETVADNVISKIMTDKAKSVYTSGTQGITASDIANYIRDSSRRVGAQNFDEAQRITDSLARLLADTGNPEFIRGYRGWREWYGVKRAFEEGKNVSRASTSIDDIVSSLEPTSRSGIDSNLERTARTSGFLNKIREGLDSGKQINLSTSEADVLEQYYPRIFSSVKTHNYWEALNDISKGIRINAANTALSPIQKGASKLTWGSAAAGSGIIETLLRQINKRAPEKSAEAFARLMNANKSDWKAIIDATYKSGIEKRLQSLPRIVGGEYNLMKED